MPTKAREIRMSKNVKCGTCGIEFDVVEAMKNKRFCEHSIPTLLCPNGHCICHLPLKRFRQANEEERKLGFGFVLSSVWNKEERVKGDT